MTSTGNFECFSTSFFTRSAVPTGTVDLSTTNFGPFMCSPMARATASTCVRSAEPSSSWGVPTAMKIISDAWIASLIDVVNVSRFAFALLFTRSSSPGSKIGISPPFNASTLLWLMSTQITSLPVSAKHAPATNPT